MFGWHHRLNGHEFEQALGDGEGQGSLACSSPWGWTQLSDFHSLAHSENLTEMKNIATAPLIARSKICIFQYICLIKKY